MSSLSAAETDALLDALRTNSQDEDGGLAWATLQGLAADCIEDLRRQLATANERWEYFSKLVDEHKAEMDAQIAAETARADAAEAFILSVSNAAQTVPELLIDEIKSLHEFLNKAEAQRDAAVQALEAAARFLKEWDDGDPSSETGWKHDELCDAYMAIRAALPPPALPGEKP